MSDTTKAIFATLDEPVTLASSSFSMIRTREAGRVVGFGCTTESMIKTFGCASEKSMIEHGFATPSRRQPPKGGARS